MKPSPTLVLTILLATAGLAMADSQTHQTAQTHATAEAHAEANGNPSSVSKQSVTVTSDGNQTIRKTVTVRDGKEETVTEITDALGHVTRHQDHPGAATEPAEPAAGGDGPFLGVRVQAAPPALRDQLGLAADEGVVVDVVAPKSPAAKVGIRVNDILVALNATKLSTPEGLREQLHKHQPGETVTLSLIRKGERSNDDVILEKKPAASGQAGNPPPQEAPHAGTDNSRKDAIHLEVKDGTATATATATSGSGLDAVLNDPNVSEDFKKTVRDMQKKMRAFEDEHGANK